MAGSVKLFQFIQKYDRFFGILPPQPYRKWFRFNWKNKLILSICALFSASSIAYIFIDAKSMIDYGTTILFLICSVNGAILYTIHIWQYENNLKFIQQCEEFIANRINSTDTYKEIAARMERFSKIFCACLIPAPQLTVLPLLPYFLIQYYIFDAGDSAFYFFIRVWMPFDTTNPVGFLLKFLFTYAGSVPLGLTYVLFMNFMIVASMLFNCISKDIIQDTAKFKSFIVNTEKLNEKSVELMNRFRDMVQVYTNAKGCIQAFNGLYEYSLFIFIFLDMLCVSSTMVAFQFQLWDENPMTMITLFESIAIVYAGFWMFIFILFICEPSQTMANQFEMFENELTDCEWYALSIEMQKLYMIFLTDTQNAIEISTYGNIICNRDTCKKIINKAGSYFMAIRNLRN